MLVGQLSFWDDCASLSIEGENTKPHRGRVTKCKMEDQNQEALESSTVDTRDMVPLLTGRHSQPPGVRLLHNLSLLTVFFLVSILSSLVAVSHLPLFCIECFFLLHACE